MRAALTASGDVIYDWDMATDSLRWLGRAPDLFGLQNNQLPRTGESFTGRINPEDLLQRTRVLSDHLANGGAFECEYRVRTETGVFQWVHDRGAVELSPDGSPARMVGVMRMVTSMKEREAQLEYLTNFDDLTGHFNKLRLRDALEHAMAQAIRQEESGAFMTVGVDQLGMINTAFGVEAGDQVLVEIAQRLDQTMRDNDVIGRPGGDRFGIVLANVDEDQSRIAADRVLKAVRGTQVEVGGRRITVTASIGLATYPAQAKTSFDAMTMAESAMLAARASGRDCSLLYEMTESQRQGYRAAIEIGERVKQALKEDRLVLAYQPVVDALTHDIKYYECLIRLFGRDGNPIPAAEFIPVVEPLGLMRKIDHHVLNLALADLEQHPDISLAINISGLTATERSWLRSLVSRLRGRPDMAERLIVEITETAALQDIEESARFVAAVRELGCKVALDDFGAGYTTFRHMKALTVDVVKIDGSFVRGITESPENQMFIRNLVALAEALGVETVAECIEDEHEAEFLTKEGLGALQGYYFGRPEIEVEWRNQSAIAALKVG